jgi:Protein of unknown function (DUF2865)
VPKSAHTHLHSGKVIAIIAAAIMAASFGVPSVLAQSFDWPWSTSEPEPRQRPVPPEPVYREPGQAPSANDRGWAPQARREPQAWAPTRDICLELEKRLVKEGQRSGSSRDQIPALSAEISKVRKTLRRDESRLDTGGCYSYFLFSKTLKRTKKCVNLANRVNDQKQRLAQLNDQLNRINSSSSRSYQDDIVRELARNNCGDNYKQLARRNSSNPFSSLWQDQESIGGGGAFGTYNSALPYSTYRTLCVRLCDGYYFPVSFSTLPNHFERDAQQCQSKCAAPAKLFYYKNPGGAIEDMVSTDTNEPYINLKTAFLYRKEYKQNCSCKASEFLPQEASANQTTAPGFRGFSDGPSVGDGWSTQTQPQ